MYSSNYIHTVYNSYRYKMMLSELRHNTNPTNTPAGRLCSKLQDFTATGNIYAYSTNNKPHAARRIYNGLTNELYNLLWDANGNIAQIAEYLYDANNQQAFLQDFRNHYWDEDDRLNLVLDNSHFSYYLYGNDGQRVAKLTGSAFSLGTGFATNAMLDNYTLYPSEYLVVTQQGYTKYYYAGGTRIASKLGSGGFEKMQRLCTHDQNLTANANSLFSSVVANIGNAMSDYHISDPCPNYYPDIAGFRVQLPTLNFEPNFGITAQQNILQAFRQNYANEEIYYFHGNHLGSANWVTTATAAPTQFLLHLPYGEEFVKQLSGSYDERFTFTGKEKDIETGYYYFGARFDNVDLGFMSVDPMSDKYPEITPYHYCHWNPIKILDPTGEFDISIHKKITEQAMKKSGLITKTTILFNHNLKFGVGTRADVLGFYKPWHFDNMNNYYAVCTQWIELYKEINTTIRNIGDWNKKLGGSDVVKLGRLIHNVQDFYSHSNYAELYIQYYKSSNDGALPKSIPTFDEGIKDEKFNNLLKKQLRTGDYDFFDNEKFDINPFREQADEPTSHNKMNKDKADTYAGKLAKQAAIKHTTKILEAIE